MKKPFKPKKSFGKSEQRGGDHKGGGHKGAPRKAGSRKDGPRMEGPRKEGRRFDEGRPEAGRHEGGRHENRRPEGGRKDGRRQEGGRQEGGRTDNGRRENTRHENARHGGARRENVRPEGARRERFGDQPRFEKPAQAARVQPAPEKRRDPQGASPRLSGALLWGFHAVREAWANPKRRILRLVATEAGLAGFQDAMDSTLKRPQAELLDKGVFDRMMPPGAVHQGIVAVVEPLPQRDAHDLIAGLGEDDGMTVLILDQVTDPHNVGAILRSAAAFGAGGVIMQDRHAPELTGVLAKTASGAADVIPVAVETNLSRAIEMLQENGFFVAGLDERGDPLPALAAHKRLALVLGAEGTGLRRNVADHCDALVSLPTQGSIRSLNVSNAAAVALYAVTVKNA